MNFIHSLLLGVKELSSFRRIGQAATIALATYSLMATGCGHSQKENTTLVVYAAGPRELAETICKEFEKREKVQTLLFSATTGEIMAKLKAEELRPRADVVILAGQTAAQVLKEQGALARLPEGEYLHLHPEWNDPEGRYVATGACALGVAMRREHYDPNLDWKDIFNGAITGRMIMPSPSQSGSSAEFVVGFDLASPDLFWKGISSVKAHGLQVSGPNNQALTSLVMGAHEAVLGAADYLVFRQIEKGEPLVMHFPPSGCPLSLRPIGILATSTHQETAGRFVQFCLSPDMQKEAAAVHLLPADPKVEVSPLRKSAAPLHALLTDVQAACRKQESVLSKFRAEIEQGAGGMAK